MKAVVIHQANDLRVEERPVEATGAGEVEISVKRGGICGSDLHYFRHGGFGTVQLKEPMILGHEVAGVVTGIGPQVNGIAIGDQVAVNPSLACGTCVYCQKGQQNQCLDMRFYGSAMRTPHVQGAFRERLVARQSQCHRFDPGISLEEAAICEPFAVGLHAVTRAGPLIGKRLLVTGCGPIGVLAIVAARAHGTREIVATDVSDFPLQLARRLGADRVINIAELPDALNDDKAGKGTFDIQIEASGNEQAVALGLEVLKPRGRLVQLGLGGELRLPQNTVVAKEIEMHGSFRFHDEFALAADLINRRRVDLKPLLTGVLPVERADEAFRLAGDRTQSMKVQLAF